MNDRHHAPAKSFVNRATGFGLADQILIRVSPSYSSTVYTQYMHVIQLCVLNLVYTAVLEYAPVSAVQGISVKPADCVHNTQVLLLGTS